MHGRIEMCWVVWGFPFLFLSWLSSSTTAQLFFGKVVGLAERAGFWIPLARGSVANTDGRIDEVRLCIRVHASILLQIFFI